MRELPGVAFICPAKCTTLLRDASALFPIAVMVHTVCNSQTSQTFRGTPCLRIATSWAFLALLVISGCGKTVHQAGTEQLLTSDAVDRAIAQVDFSPMRDQRVYLDTQYLRNFKTTNIVNADYIISATRQHLLAAGCLLQETDETADIVLEARVGALGNNAHELTYGIPANNSLGVASAAITGVPSIPTVPEISFARKNNYLAAAKVGYFAYDRATREPIWQSGPRKGVSRAREFWVMGAGPFQSGEIFEGTMLAGSQLETGTTTGRLTAQEISYWEPHQFKQLPIPGQASADAVQQAGHANSPPQPGLIPPTPTTPAAPPTPKRRVDPATYRKPAGRVSQVGFEQEEAIASPDALSENADESNGEISPALF